jgi:hypothetical protein
MFRQFPMRRAAVALMVGLVAGCSAAGSTPSATAPPAAASLIATPAVNTPSPTPGSTSGSSPAAGQGHIYWANRVTEDNTYGATTMGRANLDGTGVDQNFLTGANSLCGLAIVGTYIYWGNSEDTTIGRANLDGTG